MRCPRRWSTDELAAVVAGFAEAARLAVSAGLAGVEINAGQFSLLRQFLSGLTNTREDEYGTDRLLLARQVLEAVRAAVGPDPIVGLRLGCDELAPWAGITPEMAPEMARQLAGPVDYVVAVRAPAFDVGGTRPDGHTEPGFAVPLAAALRGALPAARRRGGPGFDRRPRHGRGDAGGRFGRSRRDDAGPDRRPRPGRANWRTGPGRADPAVRALQPTLSGARRPQPAGELHRRALLGLRDRGGVPVGPGRHVARRPRHRRRPGRTRGGAGGRHRGARRRAGRGRRRGWAGCSRTAAAGAGREHLADLVDWLAAECERLGVRVTTGTTIGVDAVDRRLSAGTRVILCAGARHDPGVAAGDGTVTVATAAERAAARPSTARSATFRPGRSWWPIRSGTRWGWPSASSWPPTAAMSSWSPATSWPGSSCPGAATWRRPTPGWPAAGVRIAKGSVVRQAGRPRRAPGEPVHR